MEVFRAFCLGFCGFFGLFLFGLFGFAKARLPETKTPSRLFLRLNPSQKKFPSIAKNSIHGQTISTRYKVVLTYRKGFLPAMEG